MNTEKVDYYSIPTLLAAAEAGNVKMEPLFKFLGERITVSDQISGNAALEISRAALKHRDYETAQYFGVLAINFKKDEDLNHRYIENLRMVNWFKNNAVETKLILK